MLSGEGSLFTLWLGLCVLWEPVCLVLEVAAPRSSSSISRFDGSMPLWPDPPTGLGRGLCAAGSGGAGAFRASCDLDFH